jgi:urease accessory protein
VGGDCLETSVELAADANVLLTTPAAQKLYRSRGARSEISNLRRVGRGAGLEWLPSETLAFSAAQARLVTRVELDVGARFLGWDIACYGMPARAEAFTAGRVASRFEIWREGSPLSIESFDMTHEQGLLDAPYALRGQPVVASMYAVPGSSEVGAGLVERVREAIGTPARGWCSVSSLSELVVIRALGPSIEAVRHSLIAAWRELRPAILGRTPVTPRIWST